MNHILARIHDRVSDDVLAQAILSRCIRLSNDLPSGRDYAVRVVALAASQGILVIGPDGTGPSNGDTGVVVVRRGTLVTFMWRRSNQPHTAIALRVDAVTCFDDVCTHGKVHR